MHQKFFKVDKTHYDYESEKTNAILKVDAH